MNTPSGDRPSHAVRSSVLFPAPVGHMVAGDGPHGFVPSTLIPSQVGHPR